MHFKTIVFFVLNSFLFYSHGQIDCYSCGFSSADTDRSCLTITKDTPVIKNCPFRYCTIVRQDFTDPKGVIASFIRSCLHKPDFLNHEVSDPTFITYYRACTSDLCNIGDGIQPVAASNLLPRPAGNITNLLVPGTGRL